MKTFISIALVMLGMTSFGQTIAFKTGDTQLDSDLNKINTEANKDLGGFKTSLNADYKVSSKEVDYMFSIKMAPGEIYLALEIAKLANKPLDMVIKSYQTNKDKGWGYIAKQMGIKPGSPEFHALKGNSKNKSNGKGKPATTSPSKTTPAKTSPAKTTPAKTSPANTNNGSKNTGNGNGSKGKK